MPHIYLWGMQKCIFIVDDDSEDILLLVEGIKRAGSPLTIYTASDGQEAMAFLDRCSFEELPCTIVLDYNMPKLNGLETLKRIKAEKKYEDIKIIFLSTSQTQHYIDQCLQNGANAYITKPTSVKEVDSIVYLILELCVPIAPSP